MGSPELDKLGVVAQQEVQESKASWEFFVITPKKQNTTQPSNKDTKSIIRKFLNELEQNESLCSVKCPVKRAERQDALQ